MQFADKVRPAVNIVATLLRPEIASGAVAFSIKNPGHSFSVPMPYPDTARSSKKNDNAGGSTSLSASAQNATAIVNTARNRAVGFANAARDWFHPPSFPDWFSSLSQIESLTTVMFSPLRGHPAYRSESLARALQLMQQQQHQRQRSTQTSSGSDVVLHSGRPALPSSSELLKAEIPESQAPLSLFQGFAAAYPSLATPGSPSSSPKKSRHRRKKHGSGAASIGSWDMQRNSAEERVDIDLM